MLYAEHPRRETRFGRLSSKYLLKRGKPAVVLAAMFYFLDILGSIRAVRRTDCDDVVFVRYLLEVAYFPDSLYRMCYAVASGVLEEQDVSIFVDTDPDIAFERIQLRGDEIEVFETPSNLSSTRGTMMDLASDWYVIDNRGTQEETFAQLDAVLARVS